MTTVDKLHHSSESDNEEDVPNVNYVVPPAKPLNALLELDKDDEALERYKATLLGKTASGTVIIDAGDPSKVILNRVELISEGREPLVMTFNQAEEAKFTVKEGAEYRLRFYFYVQRDIVTGLKYTHKVKKSVMTVDKVKYMFGSFPPSTELHYSETPVEEAPKGFVHRGSYKVHSEITDDDGHVYQSWAWTLKLSSEW